MVASDKQPRKRPKQARARATFDAIVEATDLLLDDHDLDRLTIQMIADRAGVGVGSFYQYFPTKDAVVATVLDRDVERVYAAMVSLFEGSQQMSPEQLLSTMVRGIVTTYTSRLAFYRRVLPEIGRLERDGLIRSVTDDASSMIREMMRRQPERFVSPAEHHERAAFIATRTTNLLAHAAVIERPELSRDPAFIDEVSRLLIGYLVRPPQS